MERSYWYHELNRRYPALDRDITVDTAVIGGGLAGMTCAYELLSRGRSVCVLEANVIGSGQTGRSSAFVSFAHDLIYDRLIKKHGEKTAQAYLDANAAGLDAIRTIVRKNRIDCGLTDCDMYLYTQTESGVKKLVKERDAYVRLGMAPELTEQTELPFPIKAALKVSRQCRFDPYRYLTGLAQAVESAGGQIFEDTLVTGQPEKGALSVNGHTVSARHFVVATHFPYLNVPGFYFTKMYQSRSHNVVFRPDNKLNDLYEEVEENGFEYRPVPDGILCGGANVRTGNYGHESQYQLVEESIALRFGGDPPILSRFSAQDCITYDMLPLVGPYGSLDGVYVITGFNKWGFTNSVACARMLADLFDGDERKIPFDSKRAYFSAAPLAAAKNIGEVVGDYASVLLSEDAKKLDRIANGQGAVVRVRGRRLGVYRDEKGGLHVIHAICPHMGCALKWNKDELSWDCPCHGSRFDADGKLLNGPALTDAHRAEIESHD